MSSPKSYFEESLPATLAKDPEGSKSVGAVYQFIINGDNGGTWVVNLTKDSDWVSAGPSDDAQCSITMEEGDFMDLVTGKLPGMQAFMLGKLKIEGDMGLAMKLQQVLV
ncbi:MAG: sterol-binding protein [Myxococcales bacterium]|nr:sterol-binding protein [Myxococcales bacterium]